MVPQGQDFVRVREQFTRAVEPLTHWRNITAHPLVDDLARSLKVAGRVRIPLGLQLGLTPFGGPPL